MEHGFKKALRDALGAQRLVEAHDALLSHIDSFEPVCPALPYLYVAIARGTIIDLDVTGVDSDEAQLVALLRSCYPDADHWIWEHVRVEAGVEGCVATAPDVCIECGRADLTVMCVSVDGDDGRRAWVCDDCGHAHLIND